MDHCMIDLETLDTEPTAVILSIAAVQFDVINDFGEVFKQNVSTESCIKRGRTVSADTLRWWFTQDAKLIQSMFENFCDLHHALNRLSVFLRTNKIKYVWGNSAAFDLGILSNAYKSCNIDTPWSYRDERCYRTIVSHFGYSDSFYKEVAKKYTAHNPLHDCYKQIEILTQVLYEHP